MSSNKKVVIIGGGASGVSCALDLFDAGFTDIQVIESEERLGGLAYSFEHNGKFFHTGYHQILESDKPLLKLFKRLNLFDKITWNKCANVIYYDGRVYNLTKIKDFISFPMNLFSKMRFIFIMSICYLKKDWSNLENISAEEWITKYAGYEVLNKLFAPLFDIKFGLKSSEVSAAWVGSRLGAKEGSCRFGCIIGKEWTHELFKTALDYLGSKGIKVHLKTRVNKINTFENKITNVDTSQGVINADIVISTISPIILNKLIELNDPALNQIQYIDSISTIISTNNTKQNLYWLMLMNPREFAGGIFNLSNLNPELGNNQEIILNFFTNVNHDTTYILDDEELLNSYKTTYKKIYNEDLQINWYRINRIPFVSAKYVKGYKNPAIQTNIGGLYLTGNYMSYPSVTSTGTAIDAGSKTAQYIINNNK